MQRQGVPARGPALCGEEAEGELSPIILGIDCVVTEQGRSDQSDNCDNSE